jgi:hypothetical protein
VAKPHIRLQRPECCIRVYIDGIPDRETWDAFMSLAAKLYLIEERPKHSIRFRHIELGVHSDSDWEELKGVLLAGQRAWDAERSADAAGKEWRCAGA